MLKNQLFELQEHMERYCNVLPVFGSSSTKYDLNLIKSSLLPMLVKERDIEPTVIKKANQFMSFINGDVQQLEEKPVWFTLEGIPNSRDQRIFPLRMV